MKRNIHIKLVCIFALLAMAAGCGKEMADPAAGQDPAPGQQAGGDKSYLSTEFVITAGFEDPDAADPQAQGDSQAQGAPQAQGGTKVTVGEVGTGTGFPNSLRPSWEVGDVVVGWDDSSRTYGFEVTYVNPINRAAGMSLIVSGENAGTMTTTPADGTVIYLAYVPGKKPSDVSGGVSIYITSQSADEIPLILTASGSVENRTMAARFKSVVAIIGVKTPVMDATGRAYNSISVTTASGGLSTLVQLSSSGASYAIAGTITKAVDFTTQNDWSSDSSLNPDRHKGTDTTYIAVPPANSADLIFTATSSDGGIKNIETCTLTGKTMAAGHYYYIEAKTFEHPWVEIGGVKWATMNIGATTIAGTVLDDYSSCAGDYFAWGATEPWYSAISWSGSTPSFTWKSGKSGGYATNNSNTPYYSGSAFTKYTTSDGLTNLDAADDAATACWGSLWRMPTTEEFVALRNACTGGTNSNYSSVTSKTNTSSITTGGVYFVQPSSAGTLTIDSQKYGVKGILFVDKTDPSKRVFFPAAGHVEGTTIYYAATTAYYWSSSLTTSASIAYDLCFSSSIYPMGQIARYHGLTVRPVRNEPALYPGTQLN